MADGIEPNLAPAINEDPFVGKLFADRYQILELLGRGGMGVVYRAEQIYMKRTVALKMLLPGVRLTTSHLKRFQKEAQAVSVLTHPNIVAIHDFGIYDHQQAYLAMELLRGHDLGWELEKNGPLALDRFLRVFVAACDALSHAHRSGVVHRDIKDTNIMLVDKAGESEAVRIVDFGLASIVGDDKDPNLHMTETGALVGTPLYMSPEQCRGQRCDVRADVYSLGCVMYQALTGVTPFNGESVMDVMHKHMREFAPSMGLVVPQRGLSQPLERLVAKCLAKEKQSRYQSMDELREALLSLADGATAMPPAPAGAGVADHAGSAGKTALPMGVVSRAVPMGAAPADGRRTGRTPAVGNSSARRKKARVHEGILVSWLIGITAMLCCGIVVWSVVSRIAAVQDNAVRHEAQLLKKVVPVSIDQASAGGDQGAGSAPLPSAEPGHEPSSASDAGLALGGTPVSLEPSSSREAEPGVSRPPVPIGEDTQQAPASAKAATEKSKVETVGVAARRAPAANDNALEAQFPKDWDKEPQVDSSSFSAPLFGSDAAPDSHSTSTSTSNQPGGRQLPPAGLPAPGYPPPAGYPPPPPGYPPPPGRPGGFPRPGPGGQGQNGSN